MRITSSVDTTFRNWRGDLPVFECPPRTEQRKDSRSDPTVGRRAETRHTTGAHKSDKEDQK